MSPTSAVPQTRWHLLAAVAAWAAPGLGHYLLGQRRRGIILGVTIGSLWLLGLLIGGVSVLDRQKHPAWFVGQMLVAPSGLVAFGYLEPMQAHVGEYPPPGPDAPYRPSFGRTNEQGVLFTALAGMLNLLAIIDAAYRDPEDPRARVGMPPADEITGGGA